MSTPLDLGTAWPLVGRDAEVTWACDLLGGGRPQGVLIAGAAGVGKTELARAITARLGSAGTSVRWVTATQSASDIPLGALAPVLGATVGADRVLPPHEAVIAALESLGDGRAVPVLVVDDAHLLDPLSLTVVHHLATQGTASTICTARMGEVWPASLLSLWRSGLLERRDLGPLDEEGTHRLLREALGGPVSEASMARLYELTLGQPLFLRELVRSGLESASLAQTSDAWHWRGPIVSPRLGDLVGDRLHPDDGDERTILELLALAEPLPAALLEESATADALEALAARGVVVADQSEPAQIRFAHPMYGEVQRQRTNSVRAIQRRAELAVALAAHGGDPLRIQTLRIDAGLPGEASGLTRAAEQANLLLDHALGERLARAALEAGADMEATLALANALIWQGSAEAASDVLDDAARSAASDDHRLRIALLHAPLLYWTMCRPDAAIEVLSQARAGLAALEAHQCIDALRANMLLYEGRLVEAIACAEPVLAGAAPPPAEFWAAVVTAMAASLIGRAEEVDHCIQRATRALDGDPERAILIFMVAVADVTAARLAGLPGKAQERADRYREVARVSPVGPGTSVSLLLAGQAALDQGFVLTARSLLLDALEGLQAFDVAGWRQLALSSLAMAQGLAGEDEAATTSQEQIESVRHPLVHHLTPFEHLAGVWVDAGAGRVSAAVARARQAVEMAVTAGQPAVEIVARHTLVRLGSVAGQVEELERLVGEGFGEALVAARHARALASDDGPELDRVSRELEQAGALLAAADAAAQAAAAHRASRRPVSAAASADRALRLVGRCEGARTPATSAEASPLPLTTREREIAMLAARGYSNATIAAELFLSVRTVESHLHHIFQKLGIHDRSFLPELLG